MSRLTVLFVFILGITFALLSSSVLDYFKFGTASEYRAKSKGSFIPFDHDLYPQSDSLDYQYLNPGTDLAPKDTRSAQKIREDEHEARNTLHAATQMCRLGKLEKAGKLFEHALALSPRHPDVLTEYGEFLERSDVTRANQLYTRALIFAPGHSRALQNRRRTQPLVEQNDLSLLERIDRKRDQLAAIPDSSAALRRVKKEAYFQQIHHTAGIEGNTMTLAETRTIVETRMAVGGRSVMEHNEILGLDAAIKYINTTLVNRVGEITLQDLLAIHRRVMGHADPLSAGELRTSQVYVSEHVPPPPGRIHPLLESFIEWLNAPETLALHPVKYAALAHYKLVFIHPFSDGNGRTSRLLMNLIMMQAGYPPVIIRKQDRHIYYRTLQLANEGDVRPFVRFIAECAEKTLDVYVWATREYVHKIGGAGDDRERPSSARAREQADEDFVRNFNGDEDDLDAPGFGGAAGGHREPAAASPGDEIRLGSSSGPQLMEPLLQVISGDAPGQRAPAQAWDVISGDAPGPLAPAQPRDVISGDAPGPLAPAQPRDVISGDAPGPLAPAQPRDVTVLDSDEELGRVPSGPSATLVIHAESGTAAPPRVAGLTEEGDSAESDTEGDEAASRTQGEEVIDR